MTNIDALAEARYAAHDPQFEDPDKAERAELNEAVDEIIDSIDTLTLQMKAVKQNFTTRKFNMFIFALEEMREEVEGVKTDD